MDISRYQLQSEYQQALINLLRELASSKNDTRRYLVITTAPNLWLPQCGDDIVKLLDISAMTGTSIWRTEADIMDEALDRIRAAGWPDRLVARHYLARHAWIRADIALLNTDGTPAALMELKSARHDPDTLLRQMGEAAKGVSAKYAFVYDSHKLLKYDLVTGTHEVLDSFPSPMDLGLRPFVRLSAESVDLPSNVSVVRVSRVQDFVEELSKPSHTTIIIDHTMPWGMLSSSFISEARKLLPEELRVKRLDSLASIVAIAASPEYVRRLIAVVPGSITVSASTLPLREFLRGRLGLSGVVEMPVGFFMPVTGIPTSIFVLGQYRDQPGDNVVFSSVPDRNAVFHPESQQWFTEFLGGLRGNKMTTGFIVELPHKSPWSASAHSPELKVAVERIAKLGSIVELGELYDVIAGYRHSRQESRTEKGVKVVRGRDLGVPGLTKGDLSSYEVDSPVPPQCILSSGDILLQRVGLRPKAIVVTPDLQGAVSSDTVFILRQKKEGIDSYFVAQFLMSGVGQELLTARVRAIGAPTLSISSVRAIPIPLLSKELSRDLTTLQQLEQTLRARADTMASGRLNLFSADSPEDLHSRLRSIRKIARITAESMEQTDSLQFRVRNFYPFPVAYAYRLLGGLTDPQELYREQLRVAENILTFLASITLAMLTSEQRASLGLDLAVAWQGGLSPGHWRQIAQNGSKMLNRVACGELADLFAGLWASAKKDSFQDCINDLIVAKNDFKHDRGPTGADECRESAREVERKLDKAIEALDFLTEYQVLLIKDLDTVRGSHTIMVRALKCVGDHPGLPQVELQHSEPLKKGDLYIQIGPGNLVPLFPFITAQNCPMCKTREIYFIDRCDSRPGKKTILKSFERGHVEENEEVAEALHL